jgi:hypothetical protein
MTESLPPCALRTFQKVRVATQNYRLMELSRYVFCASLDRWINPKMCKGCRILKRNEYKAQENSKLEQMITEYLGPADQ